MVVRVPRVVRIALRDKPGYVSNMKWWDWLGTLPQGQATFLGSFVGLFALLVAALVNAHLNRRRDDRLRAEERRSVGTALRAELAGFKDTLVENSETLSHAQEDHGAFFLLPELARSIRIWPHMIPKLGLFDQETIGRVTDAYLAMEQYGERLLLLGGRLVDPTGAAVGRRATTDRDRLLISLSTANAPHVVRMNNGVLATIQKAIAQLDVFLRTKRWWRPWH
jgi:hypothetical protein